RRDEGLLELSYGGRSTTLAPLWAGEGWPTDIDRLRRSDAWERAWTTGVPVVVARRLSENVRHELSKDGVAWADELGRTRIELPGLFVVVGDRVTVGRDRADTEFKWSPGAGLVTEAVLAPLVGRWEGEGATLPKIAELAELTGLSGAWVSRTLRGFDAEGWTAKRGPQRGTRTVRAVVDPGSLLSSWGAWYPKSRPEPLRAHTFIRDAEEWLGRVFARWPEGSWALSGAHALEHRAPFVTSLPVVDLYLADDVCVDRRLRGDYLKEVGLEEVDSGARVRVWPTSRAALRIWSRTAAWPAEPPEVGDVRLYGDLLASDDVRREEAADHLRRTRIGF
ncbi:MAG TPA: type IV toxin-antitoxin system AbiEi family antitoxin, partial [Actinotalea sp.]|nr:type IV toxin-antitoxin system AbiEi family antitoxin [Actinotalea sp.]